MLKINQPGLLESDLSASVNLFLGAGFSTLAKNRNNQKLPTGTQLKILLLERFKRPELEPLDLQSVYTVISSEQKTELDDFLTAIFSVGECSEKYSALRSLLISHIYTTNIDDLLFEVFKPLQGHQSPVFHDVIQHGQPRDTSISIQYIPLHGCVRHEPPKYIFTAGQISSAFVSDQQMWYVFQRELQSRPTFFLGYGMQDAGVLQALHNSALDQARRWILVREESASSIPLYESLGFNVLVGDITDFLEYIATLSSEDKIPSKDFQRPQIGRVPMRDEVAQRPIREFFLGAEPSWSDAYSLQVPRRRVNNRVLDLALQGKNVAIVGLPLSGKSTILRQVAVDLSDKRNCIFFDRLTPELVDTIIAEYSESSSKPIILIDQFIDSRDGFNRMAYSGGFKFVVAESSVYFDSINIKRLGAPLNVIPCSEIDRADLQRIIEAIPLDIKRQNISD